MRLICVFMLLAVNLRFQEVSCANQTLGFLYYTGFKLLLSALALRKS